MLTREAITTADGYLKAEYFYRAAHQIIFGVILDLFADTKHTGKIDVVCVAAELGRRDLLEKVGGAGYLHTLIGSVPTAANCGHYALIVLEMAQWRALENAGTSARYEGRVGLPKLSTVAAHFGLIEIQRQCWFAVTWEQCVRIELLDEGNVQ